MKNVINVVELYEDVSKDSAVKDENGNLSYAMFNRLSRRAELRFIDWLTGSLGLPDEVNPQPWMAQKNKDWLAPFLEKTLAHVVGGFITRPDNYYTYDNFYRLGGDVVSSCDDDDDLTPPEGNTPIRIYDGDEFNFRCRTAIEELLPTMNKPIAKIVGRTFVVAPADLGSVGLEYIRYPKFASIVTMDDLIMNDQVPNVSASTDYEWDENAREALIYFITNFFADRTRENALKQFNLVTGKQARDMK